ncbi:MAG: vanadium-dependent haloperoxidase [Deltaproteobacteria bacterium]|nr:vanadium-dependent haloperoxidase [Deltaproteobacteria bacterium]
MGIADAVATSWTAKFDWLFWRPGDAIRFTGDDGNPATTPDPLWLPRTSGTPPGVFGGTPEHTSGTSTFAGAASAILAGFYCTDKIPFSFEAEGTNPTTRSYSSFSQAANEAGRSRIYGGIHFEFSNQAGRNAGNGVGHEIVNTRLRRAGQCFGVFCQCPQL